MEEPRCLYDSPGLRVSLDEANGWLYNQWLGVHNEESIKEAAAAIWACLHAHPCAKVLSDHSGLISDWQGVAPWIGQDYLDHLAAQGVRYFAWVYSQHYHDRTAMEQALYLSKRPMVAIFDDVASAYEWLRNCSTHWPEVEMHK